mgnify:CR=1 FL=1
MFFFFQAEDGIRDLVRSRGLGDVYKRQAEYTALQIKQAVVGNGHAKKDQVQAMVMRLLSLASNPSADAADALALSLIHI